MQRLEVSGAVRSPIRVVGRQRVKYSWDRLHDYVGRHSSVCIATRNGLECPGIESRSGGGRKFPHSSISAPGPTHAPVKCVPGHFPRIKTAGAWLPHLVPRLRKE